ncbi:MAG: T9SS type A sorting domain-containing protein [Paludibacteraceae bacterium]|nr:T9SS type A sorting domain-containing protein [Paludibacteraceae bacterium]
MNLLQFKHRLCLLISILLLSTFTNAQTRIQSATGNTGANTATTFSVNLGTAPQNGNTLIAVISGRTTATNNVSGISTASGTNWTQAVSRTNSNGVSVEIWYTTAISNATSTITINTTNAARTAAIVMEYTGLLYASPLDQTGTASGRSTTVSTGTTATTTVASELWIGAFGLSSSAYTLSSIQNSFTAIGNAVTTNATTGNNANAFALERKVASTGTAYTAASITRSQWAGAIATFKRLVTGFSPSFICDDNRTVTITGEGFTGAQEVNFNGTAASSFTVNSDTEIVATAPAAAISGLISVTNSTDGIGYSESPLVIRKMPQPTANTTNTTCPAASNGALTLSNIPIVLNFNSTQSQQVNLGAPLLNELTGFTLEGWIKTTSYNRNSFFGQDNAVELGFAADGSIELWSEGLNTNLYTGALTYPRDGEWHHVAGVGNGQNMFIYIDGVLVAQRTHNALSAPTNYGSSTATTRIGGFVWSTGTPNYFNGQMLKVGFWNRALTSQEIVNLASQPYQYSGSDNGLIAGYNFFEGTGTSLSRIPTGGSGTITGSPASTWTDISTYSWTKAGGGFTSTSKNISGIGTGTYNLSVNIGGCATNTNSFAVGSNGTESSIAGISISGNSPVCTGTEVTLSLAGVTGQSLGTNAQWKWYSGSCGGTSVGTGTLINVTPTTTTTYYARAEGDCNTTDCVSFTVTVNATGTWLGITTDWNDDQNWCGNIPTSSTDVIIPQTPIGGNQPVIGIDDADAICNSLTINNGASVTFAGTNNTLTMHGNLVNSGTLTANNSTVIFNGTSTISGATSTTFNNLTINSEKTLTAPADTINITGDWTNNGTFTNNSGTVVFNGTVAQDISGVTTFNNLKIDNEEGVVGKSNLTVNGVLNLASVNVSDTVALFDMETEYNTLDVLIASNYLYMGANATTTGVGDVTGRVIRTSITKETPLSFGNALNTLEFFNNVQDSMPSQITFISRIGKRHSVKDNTVQRYYQIIKTGGGVNTKFNLKLHYLDSELDTITENRLVFWDHHITYAGTSPHEHGKTEQNLTSNWLTLSGHAIGYLAWEEYSGEQTYDPAHPENAGKQKIWMISGKETAAENIWIGALNTNWDEPSNWTAGVPTTSTNVLIILPGNGRSPVIDDGETKEVKSITINSDASLTAGTGSTIIVNGDLAANNGTASWNNQGTFVPGTSTVSFTGANAAITGTTNFYNLSIASSKTLNMISGSEINVSGTFTNSGTLNTNFNGPTTFVYSGASAQDIADADYYHLELSGVGNKTLPADASINISGDLDLSSTITSTSNTIVFNGTTPQTLSGTSSSALNNVTLNNANGLTLSKSQKVDGTLTFTSGLITTGSNVLTLGCDASTTGENEIKYVNGKLAQKYCSATSKLYPIGNGGEYRPLTLEYTTFSADSSTIQVEQFETGISGTIPDNITYQTERHWNLTETSGNSDGNYTLTLNGSPFTPTATAKILRGDGTTNTPLSATYDNADFTSTSVSDNTFGNFAVASECLPPTITTQPVADATCELTGTAEFSVTPEEGTYTYSWEVNTGSGWTTVSNGGVYSNATTSTLTITEPPFSMNGYAYRAVVTRTDCGSSSTSNGEAELTVNPQPQGSLSANSICKGEEGFLTWTKSVGTGTYDITYRITGSESDVLVEGVTSGTPFLVGTITENTTFNLVSVADDNCTRSSDFTEGSATVTVNPYITWTGATNTDWFTASNWCGGVPTLTDDVIIPDVANEPVIAGVGAVTKSMIIDNESSVTIDGAYTLEMAGSLTNNGLLYASEGVLDIDGFIENNGTINTKNTLPVRASYGGDIILSGTSAQTLNAGTYNNVIIENAAGVTLPELATVNAQGKLEIKSGAKLEIGTGRTVNANNVINLAGTSGIVLKAAADVPSGSLIFNNSTENPVQATVEHYSPASWTGTTTKTYYWQYMGIPVTKIDRINPTFYGAYVRKYNEPGWGVTGDVANAPVKRWAQLSNDSSMYPVVGYELVQSTQKVYTFSGNLFNADIDTTLSYTTKVPDVSGQYPGQHVLSNPYTTGIRISDIVFGNNMDSTVYIYNSGSYAQWSEGTDKTGTSAGKYIPAPISTAGTAGIPNEIPSMQGFLVRTNRAAEGSIYINYNNVKTPNVQVQRAPRRHTWLRLSMKGITSGDGDVLWLFSNAQTTRGYDNGWDATKILIVVTGTPLLHSKNETGRYQINALPDIHDTDIEFRAGSRDTQYKITFNNENLESDYQHVYIFDKETNVIQDITADGSEVTFDVGTTALTSRFKILTSLPSTTELKMNTTEKDINIFSSDNYIFVDNRTNERNYIEVFDQTGRKVSNFTSEANSLQPMKTSLSSGIYIVRNSSALRNESTRVLIK